MSEETTPVQAAWNELDCFGCGPANDHGIGLESYLDENGDRLVATVEPEPKFTSGAENVAYGGYVASLIDCHAVWTAITFGHQAAGAPISARAMEYVTSELHVDFKQPTPLDEPIHVEGRIEGEIGPRTTVQVSLGPEGETTATGEVLTVEVTDHY